MSKSSGLAFQTSQMNLKPASTIPMPSKVPCDKGTAREVQRDLKETGKEEPKRKQFVLGNQGFA